MPVIAGGPPLADRILDCFPSGTYALGALLRLLDIVETDEVETAAVECRLQPRLLVNRAFVDTWAQTSEKLFMLILHELHHVLLGHTRLFPRVTKVDNLIFDAVINALLCRMFPAEEHTAFFTGFYDEAHFPSCLLRPPRGWNPDSPVGLPSGLRARVFRGLAEVYRALYSRAGAGYRELYDALRRLVAEDCAAGVVLIGDHGDGSEETGPFAGNLEERAPLLVDIVRTIVERWPQPPDPIAGRSLASLLQSSSLDVRRPRPPRALLRQLFRRVGGLDSSGCPARDWRDDVATAYTPIPTFDRRAAVLRALGGPPPLYYPGPMPVRRRGPTGERVHVYLDVSGSIGNLKGALYGAVLDCAAFVHPAVHLFSTVVVDLPLASLRRGVCRTTGGTDIGCVADHMRAHRVRRAVLVTDGYVGKPGGGHRETLARATVGVALTPGGASRDDLQEVADYWTQLSFAEAD